VAERVLAEKELASKFNFNENSGYGVPTENPNVNNNYSIIY
jgi:hypothetical protein